MNIDSIQNGYVLDHIQAGASMEIYRLLGLDKLDCSVAIIKNAKSTKLGRKDIIKIDALIQLDLDILGYVDPDITVSIIRAVSYTHLDVYKRQVPVIVFHPQLLGQRPGDGAAHAAELAAQGDYKLLHADSPIL